MPNGDLPIFVKWAGGKSQLIDQFKLLFPHKFNSYFEPFVGGGAVFFYVRKYLRPKAVVLSDTNEELVNCYNVVKTSQNVLLKALEHHKETRGVELSWVVIRLRLLWGPLRHLPFLL
jgi:DNA adenine methylase